MSNSSPEKKTNRGIRLSLGVKGLLLLGCPLILQVVLSCVLFYAHACAEVNIGQQIHIIQKRNNVTHFDLVDNAILMSLRESLESNSPPDPQVKRLAQELADTTEARRIVTRLDFPEHPSRSQELWTKVYEAANHVQIAIGKLIDSRSIQLSGRAALADIAERRVFAAHVDESLAYFYSQTKDKYLLIDLVERSQTAPPADRHTVKQQAWNLLRLCSEASLSLEEAFRRHERFHVNPFLANPRGDADWWEVALFSGNVVSLLFMLAAGVLFYRGVFKRLKLITENSKRLADGHDLNSPLTGRDEIAQLDATFHDMARALAEATGAEKNMIDNAGNLIFSLDAQGRFISANNACRKTLGYTVDELVGTWLMDLVLEDEQSRTADALMNAMAEAEQPQFETRVLRKDGTHADLLCSVSASPTEGTIFCIAHDIGQRKAAERFRQEVVQMVSRTLIGPLTSMRNLHQSLAGNRFGAVSEQGHRMLDMAEHNTRHVLSLIRDLLDAQKMESGSLALSLSEVKLQSAFQQAVQGVHLLAEHKSVTIEVPPTELIVNADESRLVQVLVNLLNNGIKFSPRGGNITVSACETADHVEVRVADQGRGIPEDKIQAIFERFKQVTAGDARDRGGTGLGLSICQSLIELHGGTIRVESQVGQGSAFIITLPTQLHTKAATPVAGDDATTPGRQMPATPRVLTSRKRRQSSGQPQSSLARRGAKLLAVPILIQTCLLVNILVLYNQATQNRILCRKASYMSEAGMEAVCHSQAVLNRINDAIYLKAPLAEAARQDLAYTKIWSRRLQSYWTDSPENRRRLDSVIAQSEEVFAAAQPAISKVVSAQVDGRQSAAADLETLRRKMKNLHATLVSVEDNVAVATTRYTDRDSLNRERLVALAVGGSIVNVLFLLLLVRMFSRDLIERLSIVSDNTFRFGSGRRLNPPLPGDDEIAQLDSAFHNMAESISVVTSRYRALIEHARDVMCILDSGRRFVSASNASVAVLGYPAHELTGMVIDDMIVPSERNRTIDKLQDVKLHATQADVETRITRRDGMTACILLSARWLSSDQTMLCVLHDISEAELAKQQRQEIVQMVSHDVRSPLTTIKGVHDMFASGMYGPVDVTGKQLLVSSEQDIDSLLSMLNDLLTLDKTEAGMLHLSKDMLDLVPTIERCFQNVRALAEHKGVGLWKQPSIPRVYADEHAVEQILTRLLRHAVGVCLPGSRVIIKAAPVGEQVEIKITAEKSSVSAEEMRAIFDRSRRLSASDVSGCDGAALALYLCKALVELHQGEITACDEPGNGVTVSFRLAQQADASALLDTVFLNSGPDAKR